jgi:hypothetical protein
VSELHTELIICRATYERWLGTEPAEIAAAARALRRVDAHSPMLPALAVRLRQARTMKAMLRRATQSTERARLSSQRS